MANQFQIRELTKAAHLINFHIGGKQDYVEPGFDADQKDSLGRPYFMDFSMKSATIEEYTFPHEPLIRITNRKHVVRTMMTGKTSRGTVKELINVGDYRIEIKGILFNEDQKRFPADQLRALREYNEVRESVEVSNDLLDLYGIRKMVILSFDADNMMGQPYAQKYTIIAESDEDFLAELTLDDLDSVRT